MPTRVHRYRWNPKVGDVVWCVGAGSRYDPWQLGQYRVTDIEQDLGGRTNYVLHLTRKAFSGESSSYCGRTLEQIRVHRMAWGGEEQEAFMCPTKEKAQSLYESLMREWNTR